MSNILITGVGSYLPKKVISNNELPVNLDTNDEWIKKRTGIRQRHLVTKGELTSTMAIAESKKARPSAGVIIKNYNPVEIAKIYQSKNATCLSILTEEDFFLGNLSHIYKIKLNSNAMENTGITLPVLCKDFFIDTYQVHLSKYYGADAILIILAGVNDKIADDLYNEALKLNMSVIVEVHNVEEAKRALRFKEALIGINNRNLKTLKTEINTTYDIYNVLEKHSGPLISESGIKNKDELLEIKNKTNIKTFLIGESLLKNLEKNSIFSVL